MKRIGITGGIACGKSAVVERLRTLGASVTDADALSRAATAEGGAALGEIIRAFGLSYLDERGRLDRRKLGALVFSNTAARKTLEAIIHPIVREEMEKELAAFERDGVKAAFLDIPLLYETGLEKMCDVVWVVSAPHNIQLERLMRRDGLTRKEALGRIASQMPTGQKAARADEVIYNTGGLDELAARVDELYGSIQE